jgi:hypothetical protein
MPAAIQNVVNKVSELRQTTPEGIESLVQTNFSRLMANDPWVSQDKRRLLLVLNSRL